MESPQKKALTVKDIDASLLRQVKSAVALSGKTMRDWVSEALRSAVANSKKRGKQ